jgi:hypothetical protein
MKNTNISRKKKLTKTGDKLLSNEAMKQLKMLPLNLKMNSQNGNNSLDLGGY